MCLMDTEHVRTEVSRRVCKKRIPPGHGWGAGIERARRNVVQNNARTDFTRTEKKNGLWRGKVSGAGVGGLLLDNGQFLTRIIYRIEHATLYMKAGGGGRRK